LSHDAKQQTTPTWQIAYLAADSKKAFSFRLLDLREVTSFTDHFLICSGSNQRQNQAIWDEIALRMKKEAGELPLNVEGYEHGEWILGDYGDLIVHIFAEQTRAYYDLERLWRHAKDVPLPEPAAVA
jgi:ribosome-associated protein